MRRSILQAGADTAPLLGLTFNWFDEKARDYPTNEGVGVCPVFRDRIARKQYQDDRVTGLRIADLQEGPPI
jgi:hypothetical protein